MLKKTITLEELKEDNPTFCLSPLRVFEKCHECRAYKIAEYRGKVDELKCKPRVKKEYLELKEKLEKLKKENKEKIEKLEEEISKL